MKKLLFGFVLLFAANRAGAATPTPTFTPTITATPSATPTPRASFIESITKPGIGPVHYVISTTDVSTVSAWRFGNAPGRFQIFLEAQDALGNWPTVNSLAAFRPGYGVSKTAKGIFSNYVRTRSQFFGIANSNIQFVALYPTFTKTTTPSPTWTPTRTITATHTFSPTATKTASPTRTPTLTPTPTP